MVIKLYISGISGNKEVKKKQQRVQMILDSKQIDYEAIDITEPGKEKDKEFMQQNGKVRESLGKYPLPPQIFNDEDFCGDYEDFDLANEVDELEKFLHIETSAKDSETDSKEDEESRSVTESENLSVESMYNPYEYHTIKIKCNGVNGLKEQIINTTDLAGENVETEEVKKSEVNGECETVKPSSENVSENVETSAEDIVAPEKEESSTQESKANDEEGEKENEENVEDKQEHEKVEEEAAEGEEEKEKVEASEEEKIENEETSPLTEEKEEEDVKEEKGEVESEKEEEKEEGEREKEEEKESDNESEKSQED